MNNASRTGLIGMAVAAVAIFVSAGTGQTQEASQPLIRRDLIRVAAPAFPALKRDPFSTIMLIPGNHDPDLQASTRLLPSKSEVSPAGEIPPPISVVRYTGFIKNTTKNAFIAVVLLDGEALAVAEGEAFGRGWKLLKITAERIEAEGPDGKVQVFAIQGERL